MKAIHTAIASAVVLAIGLTGCASSQPAEGSLTKVVVGISPYQDSYLPIIGNERGWYEEVGLEVEFRTLAWNAVMSSVVSGDVDVALNNTTGVVSVANAEPDVVYAYGWNPFTEGSALVVRPDGGISSVDEIERGGASREDARLQVLESLKGRTIVTTLSTDMGKAIIDALNSVGMSEDDVNFVDMETDAGLAAFLSGTGDAYLGGVPQRTRALAEGMEIAISGPDLAAPPINGLVTRRSYLDSHEDTILAFLNVVHRIMRYCQAETDECGKTITDRLNAETAAGLTLEGFKEYWQNIELYALNAAEAKQMILDENGVAYWKTTWDSDNAYLLDSGGIPAAVKADDHFLMQDVWDEYVAKYGADETGY